MPASARSLTSRRASGHGVMPPFAEATRATRVMLVDDSIVVRSIIERIIDSEADFDVVASVPGAADALDYLGRHIVDLVVLDIEMPGMNGLAALPLILQKSAGARVIILSANCEEGGPAAIDALALGAADTMVKPGRGTFAGRFGETLLERLRALARMETAPEPKRMVGDRAPAAVAVPDMPMGIGAIAIGASTGGILAINAFLGALPDDVTAPIFITQHLPAGFIPFFAEQLQRSSSRRIVVADDGMTVRDGHVYLAPGEAHLGLTQCGDAICIALERGASASGACPSVDPMMVAAARTYRDRACGVMLSGMGRDGCDGAMAMHEAGGLILVQDVDTSVVWGMPGAVSAAGIAHAVLNPIAIAKAIGKASAVPTR